MGHEDKGVWKLQGLLYLLLTGGCSNCRIWICSQILLHHQAEYGSNDHSCIRYHVTCMQYMPDPKFWGFQRPRLDGAQMSRSMHRDLQMQRHAGILTRKIGHRERNAKNCYKAGSRRRRGSMRFLQSGGVMYYGKVLLFRRGGRESSARNL